jgi:hypothetical protein
MQVRNPGRHFGQVSFFFLAAADYLKGTANQKLGATSDFLEGVKMNA